MKKNIFLILIFVILLVVGCNNSINRDANSQLKNNSGDETTNVKNNDIKVTFIELGSVKCIPCKAMAPIIAEIEKEYKGQVKVIFYDVWTSEGKKYGDEYKIKAIPTQVFLDKDGKEYFRHVGFFAKKDIIKVLKKKGVK